MKRLLKMIVVLCYVGMIGILMTAGQENTDPPADVQLALDDLSERVETELTLDDLQTYEYEAQVYSDTSLGCPQEGQMYAQVVTEGYQFLLQYDGVLYDYRVSDDGSTVILCSQTDETAPNEDIDGDIPQSTCGTSVTVEDGDTLYELARRCDTSVGAIVEANTILQNRQEILYPGEELAIPGEGATTPVPEETPTAEPTDQPEIVLGEPEISDDSPEPVIAIYPTFGTPGTTMDVIANDLPSNTDIEVGLGLYASDYDILKTVRSDANGGVRTTLTIPEFAEIENLYVAVVRVEGEREEYVSDRFRVVDEATMRGE